MDARYAVVMAGGVGARFWPASRKQRPKQMLALGPDPQAALLRTTVERLVPLLGWDRIFVVTAQHLREATMAMFPELPVENALFEPVGRNTAPCIAWATAEIRRKDTNACIGVFPADHHIGDVASYSKSVELAYSLAADPYIVTIGIRPKRAETGYGYIETGDIVDKHDDTFEVVRFVEKPNPAKAQQYVESGNFVWNSGMFFFSAETMWNALTTNAPTIAAAAQHIADARVDKETVLLETFPNMESISIDYAVMENAPSVRVVSSDFGWSDLGSWQVAWELAAKDAAGNAAPGGSVVIDSEGCLVVSEGTEKTIALVGCKDLVVVDTGDALLVVPRDRAQDVRQAVDALKAVGSPLL